MMEGARVAELGALKAVTSGPGVNDSGDEDFCDASRWSTCR